MISLLYEVRQDHIILSTERVLLQYEVFSYHHSKTFERLIHSLVQRADVGLIIFLKMTKLSSNVLIIVILLSLYLTEKVNNEFIVAFGNYFLFKVKQKINEQFHRRVVCPCKALLGN